MGFHGMSIGSLLLIFLIVLVLFGTKRLRNIGHDLGAAIKSFQHGLKSDAHESNDQAATQATKSDKNQID